MIKENLKCEVADDICESNLNFYFREKLFILTENSYNFVSIRYPISTNTCIIKYRCHKAFKLRCKSRVTIIFDKINKLANIYQIDQVHNHINNNIFDQENFKKHKMDVI